MRHIILLINVSCQLSIAERFMWQTSIDLNLPEASGDEAAVDLAIHQGCERAKRKIADRDSRFLSADLGATVIGFQILP